MNYDYTQPIEPPKQVEDIPPDLCPDKWRLLDRLDKYIVWRFILWKHRKLTEDEDGAEAPDDGPKEPSDEQITYRSQEGSNTLSLHIDTRYSLWAKIG